MAKITFLEAVYILSAFVSHFPSKLLGAWVPVGIFCMTDVTVFIPELNISFLFLLGSPSGHAMGSSCVWYVMVTAALSYTVRWKDKSAVTLHRSVSFHDSNSLYSDISLNICFIFSGLNLNKYSQFGLFCEKNQQPFIMIYFSWRKSILRRFICLYSLVFIYRNCIQLQTFNLQTLHTISLNQS